jgi:hypothetical protein
MSNALRKVERQVIRKNSNSSEEFQSAWQEYREKKWGENKVPRDTNKKKKYFSDSVNAIAAEMKQAKLIKNAIALKVAERVAGKKKEGQKENEVCD